MLHPLPARCYELDLWGLREGSFKGDFDMLQSSAMLGQIENHALSHPETSDPIFSSALMLPSSKSQLVSWHWVRERQSNNHSKELNRNLKEINDLRVLCSPFPPSCLTWHWPPAHLKTDSSHAKSCCRDPTSLSTVPSSPSSRMLHGLASCTKISKASSCRLSPTMLGGFGGARYKSCDTFLKTKSANLRKHAIGNGEWSPLARDAARSAVRSFCN